jgi:large subunit ribosomal protein L23
LTMDILIKPLITEKMTIQGEKLNRYGFIVDRRANKLQIKEAVESMYGVTVTDVNTVNYKGKRKSRYTKAGFLTGRANHFKKAYITLAGDDKIDFYSNI